MFSADTWFTFLHAPHVNLSSQAYREAVEMLSIVTVMTVKRIPISQDKSCSTKSKAACEIVLDGVIVDKVCHYT